ncbi:class I SAM-dependent DNA methyltransferase [Microbacterium sp. MTN4-26]|uniref:class I SAM-dependent DNA methyltransferase n=1 Tax=unclassified Microbacterium TaxID=2609290 RepID=UPI0036F34D72
MTACGSGNFLVIAYKELRKLEHAILERLAQIDTRHQTLYAESKINIESFYGLELDDFAVEVAILSLWIAKHQMNREFFEKFRLNIPLIPLKETGQVKQGNAARIDWNTICSNNGDEEIYLIGNPPYAGTRDQTAEQKADYAPVFGRRPFSKNLDYISLWFVKGAEYISGSRAELAFVTTNSVSRGEHVGLMFPMLFAMGVEIGFAYTAFKWVNNAKRNAVVTVAVISLRSARPGPKYIHTDGVRIEAKNINGYLAEGDDIYISRRAKPLGGAMPEMYFGNMALDGGGLILTTAERAQLAQSDPYALRFVRRMYGSKEYIHGLERYCLWITEPELEEALSHPFIADRVERTREFRASRSDMGTKKKSATPWSFREQRSSRLASILVPKTSSERRDYVPIGFVDSSDVVSDLAFAVFDPEPWVFSLITSRMHMTWVKAVAGRKDNRLRYSNLIVYNNFPVARLTASTKEQLTEAALRVLDVREYHSEKTLAELYDPDMMPDDLRLAHQELDDLVDSVYRKRGFDNDEERLSYLFGMYEQMTAEEKRK